MKFTSPNNQKNNKIQVTLDERHKCINVANSSMHEKDITIKQGLIDAGWYIGSNRDGVSYSIRSRLIDTSLEVLTVVASEIKSAYGLTSGD